MDLVADIAAPLWIAPGARALIPSGIAVAIPSGYEGQVRPRSGLALRHGITLLNSPGTIDCDYRGEIHVILVNHGTNPFCVQRGSRVAQLVIVPIARAALHEVTELAVTERGPRGFGHTDR